MGTQRAVFAFCTLSMGLTMLNSAFNFYYVRVFLNLYDIQESWFHIAQILYMVWNAVNDPLFAIIQDNTSFLLTRTRREGILYTAPFFALSFIVPWVKFGDSPWVVGLHLIISLFFYDTMFTFIGLLSCCLFTELSADPHNRLKLTRFSQIASLIGGQSILILEFTSGSLQNFHAFQASAVVLACCSCLLMLYTGRHAHTQYDFEEQKKNDGVQAEDKSADTESFIKKTVQIFKEKNFISFVITNFFQSSHNAFWGGFLAIFGEYLISTDQVPVSVRSFFYGMTSTFGGILVILGTPVVGRYGYFSIIRCGLLWKVVAGLTMYFLIGPSNSWVIMLFILLDRSFVGGTFSLFNMPLSDIADEDKEKYKRKQPISSTVFGSNALVVKPSQSLSPMLVVAILNRYGYEQLKNQKDQASSEQVESMKLVMFQLICFFPVVLGLIQFVAWSQFTIRRRIVEQQIFVDDSMAF